MFNLARGASLRAAVLPTTAHLQEASSLRADLGHNCTKAKAPVAYVLCWPCAWGV